MELGQAYETTSDSELGIIPRAAATLFEKLDGPSVRAPGSGIRAPSRTSSYGVQGLAGKSSSANKSWQLRATYVEVDMPHSTRERQG
jgi:hypothetical protein